MTNGDVLAAIAKLQNFAEEFEFIHIVGDSDLPLWQAVSEEQIRLRDVYHKPAFIMMEAAYPTPTENAGTPGIGAATPEGDLTDWALEMEAKRKKIKNYDLQVVTAWGRLWTARRRSSTSRASSPACTRRQASRRRSARPGRRRASASRRQSSWSCSPPNSTTTLSSCSTLRATSPSGSTTGSMTSMSITPR